jgi:hypothetical protein
MTGFPKSISAYETECEAIMSWLSQCEWLHQDEFDRRSRQLRLKPRKIHRYTPETIVLPLYGDPNLAILQEMQRHGIVDAKEDENGISYRLVK